MYNLEDVVRGLIQDFVSRSILFTALDISNEVKKIMPHERHRSVRDKVRELFVTDIQSQNWDRAPITVTLEDGSTAEALLYYPVSDAWDLDNKYDQQKRAQVAFNPAKVAAATVSAASNTATVSVVAPSAASATVTVSASTSVPMPTARDLWKQLFTTQPSLFPTK